MGRWTKEGAQVTMLHLREQLDGCQGEVERLRVAIGAALHELGVPNDETPAPVGNAVDLLNQALNGKESP